MVTGTLRRDDGGPARLLALPGRGARARGARWTGRAVLPGRAAGRSCPPTRSSAQRYWPRRVAAGAGDVAAAGPGRDRVTRCWARRWSSPAGEGLRADRPAVAGRASRGWPTTRSAAPSCCPVPPSSSWPWWPAYRAGCSQVGELALEAPLVIPAGGAVQVQVTVGAPDAGGQRAVEIHARPEGGEAGWVRACPRACWPRPRPGAGRAAAGRADGVAAGGRGGGGRVESVRRAGAGRVRLRPGVPRAAGGLAARDARCSRRSRCPEAAAGAPGFGLHPALLDAALHAAALAARRGRGAGGGAAAVRVGRRDGARGGRAALRVRLSRGEGGRLSLEAADGTGAPVISAGSLVLRPVPIGQLAAVQGGLQDALFTVSWVPLAAGGTAAGDWAVAGPGQSWLAAGLAQAGVAVTAYPDLDTLAKVVADGAPVPEHVLVGAGSETAAGDDDGGATAAREAAGRVLGLVQDWLRREELASARLVVVTAGAVPAAPGDGVPDLPGAACWGLVRSAQTENPGRIVLADLPAGAVRARRAADAVTVLAGVLGAGEPEIAVRDGGGLGRRVTRPADALAPPAGGQPWRLEPAGHGTLEGLELVAFPQAAAALEPRPGADRGPGGRAELP